MACSFSGPPYGPPRVDTESVRQQHPIAELVAHYGIELRRRARHSLVDARSTWIVVDRTWRYIHARVGLFATDAAPAVTRFHSSSNCNA